MRVQLVRPAAGQRKWLQAMSSPGLPLGLAYIAGALEQAGHDVSVLDAFFLGSDHWMPYGPIVARGLSNEDVVARLDASAEVFGLSVMFTADWLLVTDLVRRIRARFPDKRIVLGGEHVTALPEFSLATSAADFLVQGSREHGVPGLVHLFGIESPGLTAALPLADAVTEHLLDDRRPAFS